MSRSAREILAAHLCRQLVEPGVPCARLAGHAGQHLPAGGIDTFPEMPNDDEREEANS